MIDSKTCGDLVLAHMPPWTESPVYRPPTKQDRARTHAAPDHAIAPARRAAIRAHGPLPSWAS
eukprot:12300395-Alexandrium_andersonii.AAC.1